MYEQSNYSGGDGSSFEQAIRIELDDSDRGVEAEYEYLAFRFDGHYEHISQALVENGEFKYDVHQIVLPGGRNEEKIYFDITRFFGKGLEDFLDDFLKE